MTQKRNANDGTGRGAVFYEILTTATAVPDTSVLPEGGLGWASGFYCAEDGTLEVRALESSTSRVIPIAAFKDYIGNIKEIGTGGTIDLANVVLFWQ